MCIFLAIRATFGVVNARAKFKLFGVYGNPHHTAFDALEAKTDSEKERIQVSVRNRTQEMEATNANEEKRFQLFKARMAHIDYITLLRGWAPLLTSAFLILGNALTVVFGEWITTLNFNGRVNEAWKKAYLRPQTSSGGVDDKSQSFVSVTREPLTHAREQQQNEVLSAQAAVYGTISSSLMPQTTKKTIRTTRGLMSARAIAIPAGQTSNRTLLSAGSFASHGMQEDVPSERLLTADQDRERQSSVLSQSQQPRHAMAFLDRAIERRRGNE